MATCCESVVMTSLHPHSAISVSLQINGEKGSVRNQAIVTSDMGAKNDKTQSTVLLLCQRSLLILFMHCDSFNCKLWKTLQFAIKTRPMVCQ